MPLLPEQHTSLPSIYPSAAPCRQGLPGTLLHPAYHSASSRCRSSLKSKSAGLSPTSTPYRSVRYTQNHQAI